MLCLFVVKQLWYISQRDNNGEDFFDQNREENTKKAHRALIDVVVDVEHLQLSLRLALVLVDVRHDLAQAGQRRH